MKKHSLIAAAIILIILCTLTACGGNGEVSFGTTHYDDMDTGWEDISAYKKLSEDIIAAVAQGTLPADEVCRMYGELDTAYDRYSTAYVIHNINSYKDTTDEAEAEAFDEIYAVASEAESIYYKTGSLLLDSVYADEVFADMTEHEKKDIRLQARAMTDEYVEYQTRLNELVGEYYDSYNKEISIDGASMALDEVEEKYGDVHYEEEFNRLVAPIYLELVELNNNYAKSCGYSTFNEYAYEVMYLRDYSPDEAQVLFDGVKKYIAPIVMDLECEEILHTVEDFRFADYEDSFKAFAHSVSPSMGSAYDAMIKYGLCHTTDSSDSIDTGVTYTLPSYDEGAIYNRLYNDYSDLFNMAHEFGHFYDIYLNDDFGCNYSDIVEIPSCAAELLFSVYAKNIFDSETSALIKAEYLKDQLQFLVLGLEFAEFENRVYSSDFTTPEELNRCYSEICASYGDEENAAMGCRWSQTHHMFDYPQYYINYVTSLIPALEVYTAAVEDYEKGAALYGDMVIAVGECNGTKGDKAGYGDFLEAAGLPSPFHDESIKALAESIKKLR